MIDIRCYPKPTEDFKRLDDMLNDYYYNEFGESALKYLEINSLKNMDEFFIAYDGEDAAAIICLNDYGEGTGELKRLFVKSEHRRKGLANYMIKHCEDIAIERGYKRMVLETGVDMPYALALYEKNGYTLIENFGNYEGDDLCCCLEKSLK